ncbi:MAG: amidohydrolase family protein [Phycisphaerales bacterium JB043]
MILHGRLLVSAYRAPEPGWVRVEGGRIVEISDGHPPERPDYGDARALITPGFVDAHIHLPQIESVGCDGMELLEWLDQIVFPSEIWWERGGCEPMLRTAVRRMVREGTCGFAGYLTSDPVTAQWAAMSLRESPSLPRMRCAVGRVAMDRNAPDELTRHDIERAGIGKGVSVALPDACASEDVEVSVNPRFAISCTEELLAECGWWAERKTEAGHAPIVQTHLSEQMAECQTVRELFPKIAHYTGVYDTAGLLGERTLLAHCVHVSDAEWEMIRERGSVVVHCPTANTFLRSGLFDQDAARAHGVRMALGSDVAGGPDVALPRVARGMIEVAKVRAMTGGASATIPSPAGVWEMITRGNADALGWSDVGRIEEGARADLLVMRFPETWYDEHMIGRLLYGWSSRLIETRLIKGVPVDPGSI